MEKPEKVTIEEATSDSSFHDYLSKNPSGVRVVVDADEKYENALSSDASDFIKWAKQQNTDLRIEMPKFKRVILRRSGDYWLPLAFLANDTTISIYLNIIASYLYDKMKGSLKNDVTRVHFKVVYKDKASGTSKKLSFDGDAETLRKLIDKL